MKFMLRKTTLLILLILGVFSSLCSQKLWDCNDNLMTLVGNHLGIHASSIYNTNIEIEDKTLDLGLGSSPLATNAIGYRKKEDAIYGIKYDNDQQILFKITDYGELTDLHVFSDEINLPLAGCMSSDDDHLLIFTTVENTLIKIDLEDSSYTQNSVLIEGLDKYAVLDIAVNPMDGLVYGIAVKSGEPTLYSVVTIDPSTGELLELSDFIEHGSSLTFPSIGITLNEILIAYNPGTEDVLAYYHIPSKTITNVIEEDILPIFEDLSGYGVDGCSCLSGMIKLQKFYSQDTIGKCRNESLTYRILNYDIDNADSGFLLTDTFPEELIIKEVLYNNSEYDIDIEADSIINISSQNGLKYGLDSIVFLVSVAENASAISFESQAVLYNCVDVENDCSKLVTKSDDPKYPNEENDPTVLTISDFLDESPPQIDSLFYKCPDSIITLNLFPEIVGYEIEWSDGSTDNSRSFDKAGIYPVIIRDNCNEYELDVHVIESQINVELEPEYELIYGKTVEIFSSTDSDLPLESQSWYLDTLLLDFCEGECSSVSLNVVKNQVIKTQIINEAGCIDKATSKLIVSAPIYAPTAFSPNRDGINDIYYLLSEANILVQNLEIYDRWGGRVFSKKDFFTNDETSGWDGTARGEESAIGTYVWKAVIDINGESLKLSGEINLIK